MPEDLMRYDRMVEDAMRGVVRTALERTAAEGLPGEHHFYITFRTTDPGVQIPGHLRERYPDEMTIVLQHRFSDLEVGNDGFGVTLSFNEVPARLIVPYQAISAFADPSVRFGFTFASGDEKPESESETPAPDEGAAAEEGSAADAAAEQAPAETAAAVEPGETVVSLDRFRKKKS